MQSTAFTNIDQFSFAALALTMFVIAYVVFKLMLIVTFLRMDRNLTNIKQMLEEWREKANSQEDVILVDTVEE